MRSKEEALLLFNRSDFPRCENVAAVGGKDWLVLHVEPALDMIAVFLRRELDECCMATQLWRHQLVLANLVMRLGVKAVNNACQHLSADLAE